MACSIAICYGNVCSIGTLVIWWGALNELFLESLQMGVASDVISLLLAGGNNTSCLLVCHEGWFPPKEATPFEVTPEYKGEKGWGGGMGYMHNVWCHLHQSRMISMATKPSKVMTTVYVDLLVL